VTDFRPPRGGSAAIGRKAMETRMKTGLIVLAVAALAASGCTTDPQTQRELQCAGGVLGGAAVGGLLGNQIGGGSGRQLATAAGAGLGAAAGTQLPACR
jgi:outer membrane lipoprotein SlyB